MLMIVPLMIWSARTEIDSHAWTAAIATPVSNAARVATSSAGVAPNRAAVAAAERRLHQHADVPADERRREHHPLDADVDDARPLAQDAAQGGQGDRCRRLEDDRRDVGDELDEIADELEHDPRDRDRVQELQHLVHQRAVTSPP